MTVRRFDGLSQRLLRAGIAPRHIRRLVAEFEAHFADVVAEQRSAGLSQGESESQAAVRLGTDDVLIANILARPELHSWARHWPWLAFVLLPLLALPVQFVLSMVAAAGVLAFSTQVLGMTALHPGAVPWVVAGLQAYGMWIAPLAAAGAACFLALRSGAPLAWPIVGSALIAPSWCCHEREASSGRLPSREVRYPRASGFTFPTWGSSVVFEQSLRS